MDEAGSMGEAKLQVRRGHIQHMMAQELANTAWSLRSHAKYTRYIYIAYLIYSFRVTCIIYRCSHWYIVALWCIVA